MPEGKFLMDIEKVVAEIAISLKEDTGESVKTMLENVKREFSTMRISLKAANEEAKQHRLKANDLRAKLEDADLQISKLSDDTKFKEMQATYEKEIRESKTQNQQLLDSQKQLYEIFRNEFINDFSQIQAHPNFEKIKDKIKLPEYNEKEKKYNFDSLKDEDILFNKSKLAEYNSLGLFITEGKARSPLTPILENPAEIDPVKLAETNPAGYREWRKTHPLGWNLNK